MKAGWEIIRNVVRTYMNVEISETRARKMHGAIAAEITDALKAGNSVRLGDIASIRLERKPAAVRSKYNIHVGQMQEFSLPDRTVVRFKTAKKLADAVVDVTDVRND